MGIFLSVQIYASYVNTLGWVSTISIATNTTNLIQHSHSFTALDSLLLGGDSVPHDVMLHILLSV
jgi:hypothetical protein